MNSGDITSRRTLLANLRGTLIETSSLTLTCENDLFFVNYMWNLVVLKKVFFSSTKSWTEVSDRLTRLKLFNPQFELF